MKTLGLAMVFLSLGITGSIYAAVEDNSSNPTTMDNPTATSTVPPMSTIAQAQGVIDQIDQVKEVVRIRDAAGHEDAFFVDTNTPIDDSLNRQMAFEDLRPGDLVSMSYSTVDNTVKQIQKLKS